MHDHKIAPVLQVAQYVRAGQEGTAATSPTWHEWLVESYTKGEQIDF